MRKIYFLLLLVYSGMMVSQNYWEKIDSPDESMEKIPKLVEVSAKDNLQLFKLKVEAFTSALASKSKKTSNNIISLPNNEGGFSEFRVSKKQIFEDKLAQKFPQINSYIARGIKDATAEAHISVGNNGVFVMIRSNNHKTLFIDPYSKDRKTYMFYRKADVSKLKRDFKCMTKESHMLKLEKKEGLTTSDGPDDGLLRTYRMAIVATGAYTQFQLYNQYVHPAAPEYVKKTAVLSAINTTLTRVNAIYERDLAVRFILVGDNDKLIFFLPYHDQLTDDDLEVLPAEGQRAIDGRIGNGSYDIGHTFGQSKTEGGIGYLGLCHNRYKGHGASVLYTPVGDTFDVSYVAHEIGHQLGALHTFNNSCGDNFDSESSVEPGSGSTIMSYAGICAPDVAFDSDDYFHAVSIKQMWQEVARYGTNCAVKYQTNNTAPVVNAGPDRNIPRSTPFVLRGEATDDDGDQLTYCWEQIDPQFAVMPPQPSNNYGPMFRSVQPKTSSERYMPALFNVVNKINYAWEVIPTVGRQMNFSLIVRDNNPAGGAIGRDDMRVQVLYVPPFTVSTPESWTVNTEQTIEWEVGKTNEGRINCQNVNIKLSTDGGETFDTVLATNTPNDGSETVTLPEGLETTDTAIIMVEAADNIFYNVTDTFTIISTQPNFTVDSFFGYASACNKTTDQVSYQIDYTTSLGFSENVNLSLGDLPEGAYGYVFPNNVTSDTTVTVVLYNLSSVATGEYQVTLYADSTDISKTLDLQLYLTEDPCYSEGNGYTSTSTTLVEFNTINIPSPLKYYGYYDFKAISTIVIPGETYYMNVENYGESYQANNARTYAWIDWNQNCFFEASEAYDLGQGSLPPEGSDELSVPTSNSPLAITVPADALFGSTTLRITTKNGLEGLPNACDFGFDGEVEDYTVIVDATASTTKDEIFDSFSLAPNPSSGTFTLSFKANNNEDVNVNLFDIRGRLVESLEYRNTSSLFSETITPTMALSSGLYLVQIKNGTSQTTKKLVIE